MSRAQPFAQSQLIFLPLSSLFITLTECCTKTKGNCPNNHAPGCECDGGNTNCNPDSTPDRDVRCLVGANECDSGKYCALEQAQCLTKIADHYGRCEAIPQRCATIYNPVCGCDGETYSSDCNAAAAGVNVQFTGECNGATQCTFYDNTSDSCPGDRFCRIGNGNCRLRAAEQDGFCMHEPTVCDLSYYPVCGCDGRTYANECNAFSSGQNVQHSGECNVSPTTRIRPGGVCQIGVDVCEDGYSCINGRCAIPPIPQGGACNSGDTCANGFVCLNGKCDTAKWYTNWQYCVMDCPSSTGPCCGGNAQSWDVVYSSAEACCGQSAFEGNHDGCTTKSLQCASGDIDDQNNVVKVE